LNSEVEGQIKLKLSQFILKMMSLSMFGTKYILHLKTVLPGNLNYQHKQEQASALKCINMLTPNE